MERTRTMNINITTHPTGRVDNSQQVLDTLERLIK